MLWDQLDTSQRELLDSVFETPTGPLRVAAAESALSEVRSSGSFAAEALARMLLVEALHYVPDQPETLTHLAWLRQAVDHPELADDEAERVRMHWLLKWAPNLMLALPQVSLDEVERGLDDLEGLYRRSGFALRPVLGFRAKVARERGTEADLRRVMAQWVVEPRDRLSDCLACDTAAQGMAWERLDPARAAAAWEPLFDGSQRCTEEPQRGRAHDALLRLEAGDAEGALAQVRAAWRDAQSESFNNEAVAFCLVTWTRMGNVDRALPALIDRLDWLDEISVLDEKMIWTSAAVLVLDAADAEGMAPESVNGRPRQEVRDEWHRTAAEIARAFDARNGTTYYTDRLQDWLDLSRVSATPQAPRTRVPSGATQTPERPASIASHADRLTAQLMSFGAGVPDLLAAWLHHRDDLLDSARPQDEVHIALLERHAASHADTPGALLDRAEQAARACADDVARLRVEAERLVLLGDEDPGRGARLVEIAEQLARDGADRDASGVWRMAARLAESAEQAEQLSLAGAEASRRAGDPARQGLALVEAARVAGGTPDRAMSLLEQARPLLDGHPTLQLMADDTEARLLAGVGRTDDAVGLLERALEADHPTVFATPSRLLLCDLLTDAERMDELFDVSRRVMSDAVALEDPVTLALGQRFHGLALVEAGRPAEALELLDAAVPVVTEKMPPLLGPLRWAHAQALTLLGEPGPARTSYAAAATAFEAVGRLLEAAHAQLQAGHRAWEAEDHGAAEVHFDASAGFAEGQQDPVVLVEAARARAVVRHQARAVTELVELDAVTDDVRQKMASWGIEESRIDLASLDARILRDGANLLADRGRFDEAATRMRAAETVWPDEDERWVLTAERGLFLAGAERFVEAETLIREALTTLGDDRWAEARHAIVMQWVSVLDREGRSEDADRIWDELGGGR